jgi:RNA polymerase sigma-70 factor (ECF subfamily)
VKEPDLMHVVNGPMLERWSALSDEEVVARVLRGQTALFEVLMRRHNERVYRAARAVLRDDREAEDVMQQAYVNAYTHLRQFDGRAKFSTWLTKIAVYEAIARARKRGRYEPLDDESGRLERFMPPSAAPDPERQAFARELGALLESAVDGLGDGYREVFMLREVEGMSTAETAAVLEIAEDAVKTRLSRAKAALRRDLLDRAGATAANAFTFGQARCDRVVAAVFTRISDAPQNLA